MQVYLSVTPQFCREGMKYRARLAHVAYRIGPDSHLLRQNLLIQTRGGLLSLSDEGCPPIQHPDVLCRELWQECGLRGYSGVLADFEAEITPDRMAFLRQLNSLLDRYNRRLFLPEALAVRVPASTAVVCTALSGGIFTRRMEEAARRFGPGRTAMDIQRLMMDFPLPCPSGTGAPLTLQQLEQLRREILPTPFYSRELCAKYFTYTRGGQSHFVVFDDGDTLREKLRTGNSLGLHAAFLMYPEVCDLLPDLLPRQ